MTLLPPLASGMNASEYAASAIMSDIDRTAFVMAEAREVEALERFEALVQSQKPAETPWTPVTDYSAEGREPIEQPHAELIRDVFQPVKVLDAGCGPGHLIRLLRKLDVSALGFDKSPQSNDHVAYGDLAAPFLVDGMVINPRIADLVICREVLEHLTIRQIRHAVTNLCKLSSRFVYVTTRFAKAPLHLLDVDTSDEIDPTHITMLNQSLLRLLFVLEGFTRRADLEDKLDWKHLGRVLVYERA